MDEPQDSSPAAFVGSIGFFRTFVEETEQWLAFWDEEEEEYRLIQAARGEGESYRTCLHKAIESVTGLSRDKDYIISGLSAAHHQAPIEWPDTDETQWVIVQFFPIQLYGQRAHQHVEQLSYSRWLSLREIADGRTMDGQRFSSRQQFLIERADIIPAHLKQ